MKVAWTRMVAKRRLSFGCDLKVELTLLRKVSSSFRPPPESLGQGSSLSPLKWGFRNKIEKHRLATLSLALQLLVGASRSLVHLHSLCPGPPFRPGQPLLLAPRLPPLCQTRSSPSFKAQLHTQPHCRDPFPLGWGHSLDYLTCAAPGDTRPPTALQPQGP